MEQGGEGFFIAGSNPGKKLSICILCRVIQSHKATDIS